MAEKDEIEQTRRKWLHVISYPPVQGFAALCGGIGSMEAFRPKVVRRFSLFIFENMVGTEIFEVAQGLVSNGQTLKAPTIVSQCANQDGNEMIDDGNNDLRVLCRTSTHVFSFDSGVEVETLKATEMMRVTYPLVAGSQTSQRYECPWPR